MPNTPTLSPERAKLLFYAFKNSILEFAQFFFPHLLYRQTPEFHREIYDLLPQHRYLAIAAPRGHAKTTIGLIVYPIWFALFKRLGNISIYSASEDFVLREITGRIKKEFEANEKLKFFFGDQKTDKWSESYFVLKNNIAFEGGGITGQLRGGRRALIGLDDLENIESVISEDQRNKLRYRINKELIPKLLPEGQMIYLGTLIHPLCYLKQLIEIPDNGWQKRVYRAYIDGVEKEGNALFPDMYSHTELQDRKSKIGETAFAGEYMNNPVAEGTQPIKEDQIRYWTQLPQQYSCVISCDPAYSEDRTADYKVASVIAIDQQGNRYLVQYVRTHEPQNEYMNAILNLYQQHKNTLTGLGIPSGGVEKGFYQSFLKFCDEKKIYPPVQEIKNIHSGVRNKQARIVAALQGLFERGKYYIHAEHIEAREEILTIGASVHDDLVDSMAAAEQLLQPVFFDYEPKSEYAQPVNMAEATNYGV